MSQEEFAHFGALARGMSGRWHSHAGFEEHIELNESFCGSISIHSSYLARRDGWGYVGARDNGTCRSR